jgi:hypothetical protein
MKLIAISTFASILLVAFGATAKLTNDFVKAVIQGRQLAQQILEQKPTGSFTNTGVLKIRDAKGRTLEVPVQCAIIVTTTNWQSIYRAIFTNTTAILTVVHPVNQWSRPLVAPDSPANTPEDQPKLPQDLPQIGGTFNDRVGPDYSYEHSFPNAGRSKDLHLKEGPDASFAGSDFTVGDLCLEFLHWPEQKILKPYEMRRGRSCKVLESTDPNPSANGYSRVVSWIDNETLGIVQAEAYDAKGKLLKEFYPKSFKKVNGQWDLQEMEIRNDQTGSRTRLEFNLKPRD